MQLADRGAMGHLEVQQSPLQPKPTAVAAESASGRDNNTVSVIYIQFGGKIMYLLHGIMS